MKRSTLLIVIMFLLIIPVSLGQDGTTPAQTEILWDTWGVPHIFAPDNESLFYAFGWAQAHNHGDLILKLYGEARGRAAEYWGEAFLESDIQARTVGIPDEGAEGYSKLPAEFQSYVDAFANGINDYATANPDLIGEQWKAVLPIEGADIIRHSSRSLRYNFVARSAFGTANRWEQMGSNAWAVGPSRSATGNAMLVINPHQPWSDMGLWMEAHFITPDVNLYGAALMGSPVINIGFNDYLGWAHTVNTQDGWDLYELTLTGTDGYLFNGEELTFDVRTETILVREDDGEMREVPLTVRESIHGPVIAQRGENTALALRVVGENSYAAALQWWEMGLARSLEEFEAALQDIRIPMFTIMYADRQGNIMHLFNAQVPIREEGDWAFWNNTTIADNSNPAIIPGDTSYYLWTEFHAYEDLPRVLNPETGWLQNANEPPWTTTLPLALDPNDYPPYMAPPPFVWPRPQSSMRLLYEDESITFEEVVEYKHSTFAELTNAVLDDLIAAARERDSEIAQQAADILEAWDRHTDADSVGAVLFTLWAVTYVQPIGFDVFAIPWSIDDPLNTPQGLANPVGAAAALEQVARQLEILRPLGGGIDVPYGDIFRLRYGEYDLPANGSFDLLGTFRILTFVQDTDLRFRPVHGDSFIAVVVFSDPIQAKVLLSYGNATQDHSPHVGDQLELFAAKELRDAWLTREDIEANLQSHTVFDAVNQ